MVLWMDGSSNLVFAVKSRLRFSLWVLLGFVTTALVVYVVLGHVAPRRRSATPDTPIDDLTIPAEEILAFSPDIAKIEVLVNVSAPRRRIIHIADWHFLPREKYRMMQSPPSEKGYSEYVRRVEELQ